MAGLIGGSSSKTLRVKEFRASGTFPVPSGVKTVELFLVGGGGGGGASGTTYGGAGGHVLKTKYDVSGKASCSVLIGAGGANAAAGGATSFDGVVVANGGLPFSVANNTSWLPGGLPGGEAGFGGHGSPTNNAFVPANGGAQTSVASGSALNGGTNTGGGGGIGGTGGSGYVRVEWYE